MNRVPLCGHTKWSSRIMGGNRQSRPQGSGSSGGNLLEGSAWLRQAVQHYQKKNRHGGVSGFDSFTIEPFFVDEKNIQHFRVNVAFRDAKRRHQQVFWIVKVAEKEPKSTQILHHELRVYTEVLTDVGKFLSNKKNHRARFLLNVPDFIFHDRIQQNGKVVRCHLITEDVEETKRCNSIQRTTCGLNLSQFKVWKCNTYVEDVLLNKSFYRFCSVHWLSFMPSALLGHWEESRTDLFWICFHFWPRPNPKLTYKTKEKKGDTILNLMQNCWSCTLMNKVERENYSNN